MPKTSNVFARVEPELKTEAELVLTELGLPMSNAITLFLKQVVLCRGVPFPITLPRKPKSIEEMSADEIDEKLSAGWADYNAGRTRPAEAFVAEFERKYGE